MNNKYGSRTVAQDSPNVLNPTKELQKRIPPLLLVSTVISRLIVVAICISASYLPLFDSSPRVLLPQSSWTSAFLRWDAFYFARIATDGYMYEHEWAFFPGTPLIMRYLGSILGDGGWAAALTGGALVALLCDSTFVLYELSLHHLGSQSLALLVALLSLLPSSPATLRFAPYTEPFFTYFSYRGMLSCAKSKWMAAACYFCAAGAFRSNGIMLSGFIVWGLLVDPIVNGRRFPRYSQIVSASLFSGIVFIPFIYHQYAAYQTFCINATAAPVWCARYPPAIYTYVQSTYWNVGFLKYWTLSQLPNFILAAPVLLLLVYFSIRHLYRKGKLMISSTTLAPPHGRPFLSSSITPHAIHALVLSMALLFGSHTQIALRVAASMPFTYWAAAWLIMDYPTWGKWWVGWSVIWGFVSMILWSTFLPPA